MAIVVAVVFVVLCLGHGAVHDKSAIFTPGGDQRV